ncbi:hypothetical protein LCGC14_1623130 [marine sediment metagenome]|uniref:Cobalamin biosynthesis protein CobT VWA domain-containing protein n=1 Tax=marine sediment metagenome TaxID=412755 RepID=A0A0F9L4K5_9ZZZZ
MRKARYGTAAGAYLPIAEHIAMKQGLRIIQSGTRFSTTGKSIKIPSIPKGMEDKFERAILGGILHEGRHCRESDFKIINEAKQDPKYNLLNMVEDLRIEHNAVNEYPGAKQILTRLNEYAKEIFKFKNAELARKKLNGEKIEKYDKIKPMRYLGIAMNDYMLNIKPDLGVYDTQYVLIVSQMVDLLEEIKDIGPGLEGTRQSMEISVKIYKRLSEILQRKDKEDSEDEKEQDTFNVPKSALDDDYEDEGDDEGEDEGDDKNREKGTPEKSDEDKDEDEGDKEDGEGSDGDSSENVDIDDDKEADKDGDSKTQGEGDQDDEGEQDDSDQDDEGGQDDGGQDDEGEQDDGGEQDADKNTTETTEKPDGGSGEFDDPDFWEDIEQDMEAPAEDKMATINEQIKEEVEEEIRDKGRPVPHPDIVKDDVYLHEPPSVGGGLNYGQQYEEIMTEVSPQIGILRGRLLPLLLSQYKGSYLIEQEEGEIDETALVNLRSGSQRVFRKKIPRQKINTAITFLGDVSGSMAGSKIQQLKCTLIACAETCEPLHVPYEILAFTTASGHYEGHYSNKYTPEELSTYNRFEPIKHIVIKDFGETLNDTRWRLARIQAGNCNCDPEAIWWAGERLLQRKEMRKILFVMHDGWPNCQASDNDVMGDEIKYAGQTLENNGVEVYGIGIETDTPKEFYPPERCLVIWSTDGIAEAIYKLLETKLTEGDGKKF